MGDGLPAFAPQWLTAGNTSLRAGTQGSTQSKEEANKSFWRESGSRLGLGAGADREALDSKPSQSSANRRPNQYERPANYSARGQSYGSSDRGGNFRQAGARPLSDRELVEQTSALKVRPGRSNADSSFAGDSFHTGYGLKDAFASRGSPASRGAGSRRNTGQRSGQANGRGQERDFANLGRQPVFQTRLSPTSALLSPRQQAEVPRTPSSLQSPKVSHSEQQWTTRLADTPNEVPRTGHMADLAASLHNGPSQLSSPAAPVQKEAVAGPSPAGSGSELSTKASAPRMADAIAQAQAAAAQEAEAERLEKARKEQLALRQSKQLVPVIATPRAKHATATAQTTSLGTLPAKKASGMEPLGKSSILLTAAPSRKEEAVNGVKRTVLGKVSTPGTPSAKPAPVTLKLPARKAGREHDRLSFFSSLKSRSSAENATLTTENGTLPRQVSSTASEVSQDPVSPEAPALPPIGSNRASSTGAELGPGSRTDGEGLGGVNVESMPEIPPEELAFMKSLGWTADLDDDAEGGLTEEEVAAFKARYPVSCPGPSTTQVRAEGTCIKAPSPLVVPTDTSAAQNGKHSKGPAKNRSQISASSHSELEFSDSDTD